MILKVRMKVTGHFKDSEENVTLVVSKGLEKAAMFLLSPKVHKEKDQTEKAPRSREGRDLDRQLLRKGGDRPENLRPVSPAFGHLHMTRVLCVNKSFSDNGLNLFRLLETRILQEGASEMVQWLKVTGAKSGNLSLMCGTNEVEGRLTPPTSCSLTFTYKLWHVCTHP